jgi:hypothetical protein
MPRRGRRGHPLGEFALGARDVLGDHARHVVGRQGNQRLDGVLDRDVEPALSPSLVGTAAAACLLTVILSLSLMLPAASSWNRT